MYSISNAIIEEDFQTVSRMAQYGPNLNELDEYGFTPLIEASIVESVQITQLLLQNGALPNVTDVTGNTPLHWAVENNNPELCKLLLSHGADPNAYNLAGQPVLVMAMLRGQKSLTSLLIQAGADQVFAYDYINVKLLGHLFELIGTVSIVDPKNRYVEVDFEGFFLEVTVGLVAESLTQFQNHFAARQFRRYAGLSDFIVRVLRRGEQLIKYQQYRVDRKSVIDRINHLVSEEPIIIPVGYEGHAITFIHYGDIWVKCDRREDSRLYDNVMFYKISHPDKLTPDFIKNLIYVKQSGQFINSDLDQILGLKPLTEIKVESQISGNCSWANVEATIPALFYLVMMQLNTETDSQAYYKKLALNYFHRFREWNKDRSLQFCIKRFLESDTIRKAAHAEIMAAILFQRFETGAKHDRERIEAILNLIANSPYKYLLDNYVRVYYFEGNTDEGKRFYEYLKGRGLVSQK